MICECGSHDARPALALAKPLLDVQVPPFSVLLAPQTKLHANEGVKPDPNKFYAYMVLYESYWEVQFWRDGNVDEDWSKSEFVVVEEGKQGELEVLAKTGAWVLVSPNRSFTKF